MTFTKWSDMNNKVRQVLKPDLGNRGWGEITAVEKEIIWKHFMNKGWCQSGDQDLYLAVVCFSDDYKARSYCNHLLNHGGPHVSHGYRDDCCNQIASRDFEHIFKTQHQDVVYELISYYAAQVKRSIYLEHNVVFMNFFNDLSNQFGLNVILGDGGLILRQDDKIMEEIYKPTLKILVDKKWEAVSRELDDAFTDYLKNTPEGYSSCITHSVSGVQAFLQILIKGETGKGDISELVKTGIKSNVIPNDPFSSKIFNDLVSILMQERQSKGDSHPKSEYANEKSARLVLNLVMIFIQHSLQS